MTSGVSLHSTEREGFEPPSPFGRSLSRRVQYHSASAPERQRPDSARYASAGALIVRNVNSYGTSVGVPGFEPGTSASRTQRSTGLSHTPNKKNGALLGAKKADRVGFEPTRQFCCPHALQACALNHSATCPKVMTLSSPQWCCQKRRGWDGPRFARSSRSASGLTRLERIPRHLPGPTQTEGVGFEPTRPFRVNALAGRRLKPLGHLSQCGEKPRHSNNGGGGIDLAPLGRLVRPLASLGSNESHVTFQFYLQRRGWDSNPRDPSGSTP